MHPFLDEEVRGLVSDAGVVVTCDAGTFNGVFRDQYEAMEVGVVTEGVKPTLICAAADVAALQITKESRLVCEGVTYKVRRIESMVAGMSRLVLRSA